MSRPLLLPFVIAGAITAGWLFAQEPEFDAPPAPPSAEEIAAPRPVIAGSGIEFDARFPERLVIRRIDPESRAALAGIAAGDLVVSIDGRTFAAADEVETYLTTLNGESATFLVLRDGAEQTLIYVPDSTVIETAPVEALPPLPTPRFGQTGGIGIRIAGSHPVQVVGVYEGGPADVAGLLPGDHLLAVDGIEYGRVAEFSAAIAQHGIGEDVRLTLRRAGVERQVVVEPQAWSLAFDAPPQVLPGWEARSRRLGCYPYEYGEDFVWAEGDLDGLLADELVAAEIAALRAEIRALRQELIETNARLEALQAESRTAVAP
jgi:membrane-associated protease RseP (regulator of RpoE activity)